MTVSQKIKHYLWIFIEYFSLIFFSFVALLPVVSCVITAFKTETEYQNTNVMTLPESWLNFDNFIQAFNKANMGRAFINSFIVLVFVVFGSVMVGSMLAYVLNRFTFPGNGLIRSLFLFATLLPGIAMQVATYQLMYQIGFINHLYGYIILSMGTDVISIYIFIQFFENIPTILSKIKVLQDVGLGYIKLGQPSTTLSGGESQRVKLATELAKRDTGKTLYVLDEPTTGLHFEDIRVLLGVLNKLVDKGNTIIVIEHNLDVIKSADYLIDMGPEGGRRGGNVLFTGTPEALAKSGVGFTAPFLKEELDIANKKK